MLVGHARASATGFKRRRIKGFFAFEVVVEQRLVDAGCFGNLLGACAGQAVFAEFADGGVEDARRAFGRRARSGCGLWRFQTF